MTDRYVNPAVGASGTGGSWAQAYKTLKEATDAAAAGEAIYFANGTADPITGTTTYTLAAGVRVTSTSDTTNNPPTTFATGATVSTTTSGANVVILGVGGLYGVTFSLGDGTDANNVTIGGDAGHIYAEDCTFAFGGTGGGGFNLGPNASNESSYRLVRCSFSWATTGSGISHNHDRPHAECRSRCGAAGRDRG